VLEAAPIADGYGVEVAMNVAAGDAGARIVEVPVVMTHAASGRNWAGVKHRSRQFVHVFSALTAAAFGRTGEPLLSIPRWWRFLLWGILLWSLNNIALGFLHWWRSDQSQLFPTHGIYAVRVLYPLLTIAALLGTLVLIFAFQADNITARWFHVILIAVPIILQVYFNSSITYALMKVARVPYAIAAPGALIGASNFFELAVATAIALYGPGSGAALATVVGVLVEVPVMLSVCRMCVSTRHWFEPATSS
jgi:hypothetical protein